MRILLVLCALFVSSTAAAQTAPATKWELRFYLAGAPTPTITHTMLAPEVTCNMPPGGTQPAWSAKWEQPPSQGTCQWVSPPGGILQSRPVGTAYTVGIVAINNDVDGPGPESARVNFQIPAIPAQPTALVLRSGG